MRTCSCRGSLVFYVLKLRNCKNVIFVFRFLGSLGSKIEGVPMEATVGFCGSWALKFTAALICRCGRLANTIVNLALPSAIHFLMLNNLYD